MASPTRDALSFVLIDILVDQEKYHLCLSFPRLLQKAARGNGRSSVNITGPEFDCWTVTGLKLVGMAPEAVLC